MRTGQMRYGGAFAVVWLLLAIGVAAQVIRVPSEQPTIQAALNAAQAGDTIQVEPGVYNENLVWPSVDGIRLVSEAGASQTTIDAGKRGRVVRFGAGITRATILEGFTFKNGDDKEGGGIYVASSPVIRANRITGCGGSDPAQNRGGGIFVEQFAAPLIERNTIDTNTVQVGVANLGAGIFVADGAHPDILSNRIVSNICGSTDRAAGGGIHVGLTGTPSPVIAANVIADNQVNGSNQSRGGGISVQGGTAIIVGNTIANNTCTATARALGGGLYLGRVGAAGTRVQLNIVVTNGVTAPQRFGGGILCDRNTPVMDYNDVWQNAGGDYFGCAPGPNDLAVDPQFAGGGYGLKPTSPLIDAGNSSLVPTVVETDADGHPRFLDGNLDGTPGNGATVDIGADEVTGTSLSLTGAPFLGSTLVFNITGPSASSYALFWSPTTLNALVNPFGNVLIGFPAGLFGTGTPPASVNLALPFSNALAGVRVHVQGIVTQAGPGGTVGFLTERLDLTLMRKFSNPIVERFNNVTQRETSVTTAAWNWKGLSGLFATYGFGGNGEDGDLVVTGTVTLDSSTRMPGADGLVDWNFNTLNIRPGGVLKLMGQWPIRLNVFGSFTLDGTIDASGQNGMNGPPGIASVVGKLAGGPGGPGGGSGGDANTRPNNPLGALPLELRGGPGMPRAQRCAVLNKSENRLITVVEFNCGGGAGGNRGLPAGTVLRNGCSGNGGGHAVGGVHTDFLCNNIQAFGREFTVQWVIPSGFGEVSAPTGATGGGAGGNAAISTINPAPRDDIVSGSGGGGGGGLECMAIGAMTISSTAKILANGGNGGVGHSTLVSATTVSGGYGAGGGGGCIWLSATSVSVQSGAELKALGGMGNPNAPNPARNGAGGDGYVIIRDTSGSPSIGGGASIVPAHEAARQSFTPPGSGISLAYSKWYAAGSPSPQWAFNASNPQTGQIIAGTDLTYLVPPLAGQKAFIAWQGAPDVNGQPDPNPANWFPAGNTTQNPFAQFDNDIGKLRAVGTLRYIRYRITLDVGSITVPLPSQIAISKLQINY